MPEFPITIFADFSCPYSYVTEGALRRVVGGAARVHHRAYELYPEPAQPEAPIAGGETWHALSELAGAAGLRLAPVAYRPRTRKAHEASLFARSLDREVELRRAMYDAFWAAGRDIGRIDVLMEIAATVGIEPEELKIALDIDRFEADVRYDQDVARRLRIPGTPAVFLGSGRSAKIIVGAQDPATLGTIIDEFERTWTPGSDDG